MRELMKLIGKISRHYSGKVDEIVILLRKIDKNLEELNKKDKNETKTTDR